MLQVLFRNNFALSRDITGLFQSFQSSSTVLDPKANPSLFQSTLVIIIKVCLLRLRTHPLQGDHSSEVHFHSHLGRRRLGQGRDRERVSNGCSACFCTEPFMTDVIFHFQVFAQVPTDRAR